MTDAFACHPATVANSCANSQMDAGKKYRKGFSRIEDEQLMRLVARMGARNWDIIASYIPDRTARQCRDRWKFYLCPSVNRTPWTAEEDQLLLRKYREIGPKWSQLCQYFENRTLNNVKNRWNSVIRKVRTWKLDEQSEKDFLYCAKMITQQSMYKQGEEQKRNVVMPDPSFFFNISNLLNTGTEATV